MKKILKWAAGAFGALIGLTLLAGAVLYTSGPKKLQRAYSQVKVEQVKISTDADAMECGKHIAIIWACTRCYGR